ncbi:MAG: hypothetical protein WBL50_16220 [Candidatus Acidiferrum sp.]
MATKMKSKAQQKEVNEVPLSETLQEAADKFLRAVKDNEWYDNDGDEEDGKSAMALVIVFRNDPAGDGVLANVLNEGLGDDCQKLMTDAALKAISGKPLFYTVFPD